MRIIGSKQDDVKQSHTCLNFSIGFRTSLTVRVVTVPEDGAVNALHELIVKTS